MKKSKNHSDKRAAKLMSKKSKNYGDKEVVEVINEKSSDDDYDCDDDDDELVDCLLFCKLKMIDDHMTIQ
ncbi:unnamed protein product [Rhizophagus irregularis]|nr:unnamed protein product [Rhizophagus irregularis]